MTNKMRLANSIQIRVFSKEYEDSDKILEGLKELVALDIEKEKIKLMSQTAIGFNEAKIKIFAVILEKERHMRAFLRHLIGKFTEDQKELLLRQKESRLDEELNFFIRLDREKFLKDRIFWITDSGNCYHITISIAAFPKKRDVALVVIEKMLED